MTDRPTTYEGNPPLDPLTQRFVDAVLTDDPDYGGAEAVDLFHVLKKAGLSITLTDRPTDDDAAWHPDDIVTYDYPGPTDDDLPARLRARIPRGDAAGWTTVLGRDLEAAADRIRELEQQAQHDALVILGMDAELAEAHADIVMLDGQVRELQALGNALADRIDDDCCDECRTAIDAWENR